MANVALFALTGFGNIVLDEITKNKDLNIVFLSTRKELRKFPYYECEQIDNFAQKKRVPVIYDATMIDNKIEYIIVATYHKLVKVENFVKCAVNIHPSFLPAYKGRDPIKDVLRNKEKSSGVTMHELSSKFDSGKIILKKKILIQKDDDKSSIMIKMIPIYRDFTKYFIIEMIKKNNELYNT